VSLRESWDRSAADWIRWARSREHDVLFWEVNLPALLGLVPPPGRMTVDVGCGEGRVARELIGRGHRVVGIEGSPALAAAAREAAPAPEVHVADAAAIPLEDEVADLAVASMSLLNIDDMPAAVREVARVLAPGGRFVFSIPHPGMSAKPLGDDARAGDYFAEYEYLETREGGGLSMTFHDRHRPLSAYFSALEAAGLLVEALREPAPADRTRPLFLLVRAVKPG
jgi:SAM-dependent methyltransferase